MIYSRNRLFLTISGFHLELLTVFLHSGMLQERLSGRRMVFAVVLGSFISWILNTSSVSFNTAQIGFSMSFSTCFRRTASLLLISLLSIGNLFELESLLKRSRRLLLNAMTIFGLILLLAWLSTYLNNLAFLMRFQRMNAHLLGLVDDLVKESELSWRVSLFVAGVSQLRACYL